MTNIIINQKPNKSKKWILSGIFFAILMTASSILLLFYPFASSEKVDYFSDDLPILFNGEQAGNAVIDNETTYVPLFFLQEKLDDSVVYDEKSGSVIIATKNNVVQIPTDSLAYMVNGQPITTQIASLKSINDELYVALDRLTSYYPIQYSILEGTNAILIEKDGMKQQDGTITQDDVNEEKLRLRTDPSLQSAYTAQTTTNESITIEDEKAGYYYVRKADGTAGYIQKEFVQEGNTEQISIVSPEESVAIPTFDAPISLTWEAVYTNNPKTDAISAMPGVNIVSPTWFKLSSADGLVSNLASMDYVSWAHGRGYQVWGVFSNAFDPELTHEAFQSYETRQTVIRQLLEYSISNQLNGINLDIENVNEEDGPLVTQFVRELTPYFHRAGLSVSMDITFEADGNWSAFYERDKLSTIVDYLAVMAYDEHWGTSSEAGSVASLPWVESNLQSLLKTVPNEKLILGVPLYTRLWEEKSTGEVSSKALTMTQAKEWLAANGLTPVYDEESGQNYAEYYDATTQSTYRIWLEDELSLQKRVALAEKYELKGVASWSRYFADDSAWVALTLSNTQVANKTN